MAEFRAAKTDDTNTIEAFLSQHTDTSMFLRSNLRTFGPCGGEATNATRMWIRSERAEITGIVGLSTAGFVLVQLPDARPEPAVLGVLGGEEIGGIIGASPQVHAMRDLFGLDAAETQLDEDEPLYSLDLSALAVPEGASVLRSAEGGDRKLMQKWRRAYLVETIHFSEDEAEDLAAADVDRMLERGSLVILETPEGQPLAMTSFNAILPDMVQVGNVYTPPDLRGKGHARRIVALHLQRAANEGVKRAILFASGPAASRAYESIGFEQIGKFTLLIFAGTHRLGAEA